MVFKKLAIALFLPLLLAGSAAAAVESFFPDVSVDDPDFQAIAKYSQEGSFTGILGAGGEKVAALDSSISKRNAAFFLAKVMGVPSPTTDDVIELGIVSVFPEEEALLDHATWIKMLSNGFKVPTGEAEDPETWFVGAYVIAQSIGAIDEEKPFDLADRRFMLRTTYLYQQLFDAKNADRKMDDQERNLMRIRDKLIDPEAENEEIETILWTNILAAEDITPSERLTAIKHLNMAVLSILNVRRVPASTKRDTYEKRAQFFLQKAIDELPDVAPFASDLEQIMEAQ